MTTILVNVLLAEFARFFRFQIIFNFKINCSVQLCIIINLFRISNIMSWKQLHNLPIANVSQYHNLNQFLWDIYLICWYLLGYFYNWAIRLINILAASALCQNINEIRLQKYCPTCKLIKMKHRIIKMWSKNSNFQRTQPDPCSTLPKPQLIFFSQFSSWESQPSLIFLGYVDLPEFLICIFIYGWLQF